MDDHGMPPGMKPAEYKAQCNLRHTDKRAYHRYDLDGDVVTGAMQSIQAEIRGEIPLYQVRILRPDIRGKDRTLYAVLVDGEWLPIIYDGATQTPVTILPQESLDPYRSVLDFQKRPDTEVVYGDEYSKAMRLLKQVWQYSGEFSSPQLNSIRGEIRSFLGLKKGECVDAV